jgi:hypothetical protein
VEKNMSFQYVALATNTSAKRAPANRRAFVRYQCGPATPGRVAVAGVEEWQPTWVLDLSLGGVGLLLSRPLESGLVLTLHLRSDSQNITYEFPARTCHVSRQPDGDWVVGCQFEQPLTDEVLDALL